VRIARQTAADLLAVIPAHGSVRRSKFALAVNRIAETAHEQTDFDFLPLRMISKIGFNVADRYQTRPIYER
jgi:hypothetical protein